ncbi:MAG: hypothetical protein GVY32_04925 [Gammaproteobacteria bacterium]|jgi:glycerophosphoryl diester phosphodiesterase|nr:hypothetical protein [Gammaproteobacteria bacterium]
MSESAREWLIAHRGWPARHPENSLEGIRAVLDAGARFVEIDVQISADGRPVAFHDEELRRTTGRDGRLTALRLAELRSLELVGGGRIPTLEEAIEAIGRFPGTTAFVELKRHSIRRFGRRRAVELVCERIREAHCPCVFLSFDRRATVLARDAGVERIGWVLRRRSIVHRLMARSLRPDFLFVSAGRAGGRRPFWTGPWRWAVYGVDTLDQGRDWRSRGADLIEVDDLPGLLETARDGR